MTGEFCLAGQALGRSITARVVRLDAGIAVLLTGGERSHIGASACAGPEGAVEVALPGHREDVLCRQWAARLSEVSGAQVWVACGVHYDGLSRKGLERVMEACERLLEQAAAILGKE